MKKHVELKVLKSKKNGSYFKAMPVNSISGRNKPHLTACIDIDDMKYGTFPEIFTDDVDILDVVRRFAIIDYKSSDMEWKRICITIED
jgi:hypothetical protein